VSKKKLRLGVIFGGESAEHDVSVISAQSIIKVLDTDRFDIIPIGISQEGEWRFFDPKGALEIFRTVDQPKIDSHFSELELSPMALSDETVDVVFPVLHGPMGEDGTVQGMLKLANVPFVGSGVLGSALSMDKDVSKRLLREAGLPVPRFWVIKQGSSVNFAEFEYPLFVKPANLGSSVGVEKAKNGDELKRFIENAFLYDHKVIIEEFIEGMEIECGVLGNSHPRASVPAKVIPRHEFYSYEAKYLDPEGATFEVPAQISPEMTKKIQALSLEAFQVLCCEGMARVDFFVRGNEIFINEVNTIPGFTSISMYPQMWMKSGMTYAGLIEKLIDLALERSKKDRQLLRQPPVAILQ
jgi:D-alanine-D-alanine ligase